MSHAILCRMERFRRNFLWPQKNYSLIEMRNTYTMLTVQSPLHEMAGTAVANQGYRCSEQEEIVSEAEAMREGCLIEAALNWVPKG